MPAKFFNLSGQTALITGGAQGIGAGIAQRLGLAGAVVAIADLDQNGADTYAAKLQEEGIEAFGIQLDVSDSSSVAQAFAQAESRLSKIDIVVNNAGIAGRAAPVSEQSDEDWQRVIDIDLTGVFYCCRAVIGGMIERDYGRIVNIASVAGKEGNPNMSAYSAAKAAVIALTKSLAKEVALKNICVNSISPAVIRTPILEQLTPEQVDYMTSRIPRGRPGRLEEVAAVAHFLASSDCSFVTGQCYDVSGGRSTY
ncbi:MAG: SDR family NAD(P)-dependent oxidoreductase [Acidobacteria bacterium]|nr:SDR family NAD(P)-dependent oxidoreductase [Acidobacteriota bacterium]MDA1233236.1 SDR family NAD(P)-dependent oxidoreductase [Acidobacteriota bacterium]